MAAPSRREQQPLDASVFPFAPSFTASSRRAMERATGGGSARSVVERNEAWLFNRNSRIRDAQRDEERKLKRLSAAVGAAKPPSHEPPKWGHVAGDFFARQAEFLSKKERAVREEKERLWREARRDTRVRVDPESGKLIEVEAPQGVWDAETREEFFARQEAAAAKGEAARVRALRD
ncbi:hypothetical protein FNF27_05134 [Cafeteria roenbergensis]|uniref:Uncharacterized protein n=1 Tax=Cafeteria roenbergensis TaxID=33653 RepID=A0A5A8E9E2_CAFRO|nr:hypothetical protein FNF27_05134 [Cafeteria roenbergensis]